MLDFPTSFGAWAAATALPAFIGLAAVYLVGSSAGRRYTSAFAMGIFFWFFVDTIEGSSNLFVNFGFTGGVDQAAIVILFVAGVVGLFVLDDSLAGGGLFRAAGSAVTSTPVVPMLAALAVGIHGLGEGTAFGSTAALTSGGSLLDAFGGATAGVAYALHKMLEPMMVGAIYLGWTERSASKHLARDLSILTVLFVTPSLVGAATGYYLTYDATYFFGLGTGTSLYAAFLLMKQIFQGGADGRRHEALVVSLALVTGFILIYVAALFHS